MKDKLKETLGDLFVISDLYASGPQEPPFKIAISQTGMYSPAFGPPREITTEMFDKMIENFKGNVLKTKLSVFYSHWDTKRKAAGEITDIYRTSGEGNQKSVLYAEVDWTPRGKKAILDKEYKYISAEFAYDFKRPKDKEMTEFESFGAVLTGVALTNEPAVYDIPQIVFSGNKKFVAQFSKIEQNEDKGSQKPEGDLKMNELFKLMGVKDEKEAMEKFSSLNTVLQDLKKEDFSKQLSEKDNVIAELKKEVETIKEDQFSKEKKSFLDGLFKEEKISKEKYDLGMKYNKEQFSVFKDIMGDMVGDTKGVLPTPQGSPAMKGKSEKPPSLKEYAKKFKPEDLTEGVE